jgi:hypothetical protein
MPKSLIVFLLEDKIIDSFDLCSVYRVALSNERLKESSCHEVSIEPIVLKRFYMNNYMPI